MIVSARVASSPELVRRGMVTERPVVTVDGEAVERTG
jgi:hypothetical protein